MNSGLGKGKEKVYFFEGMLYSRFFFGIGRSHGTGTKFSYKLKKFPREVLTFR